MSSPIEAEAAACDRPLPTPYSLSLVEVQALLRYISPFCSSLERDRVIESVHQATGASDAGLRSLIQWYRQRSDFPGEGSLAQQWGAIHAPVDASFAPSSLCELVASYGFDWLDILATTVADFELTDYEVVPEPEDPPNALTKYSLKGHYAEIEEIAGNRSLILDGLFLQGQLATTYGPPAVGKSAFITEQIRRDVLSGVLAAKQVLYIDLDNNPTGLLDRLKVLDQVGCHVLAEGFRGFSSRRVVAAIEEFIQEGHAQGSLVVLDTTKKVADLMDKTSGTEFAKRLRKLTNAGGTFIGLAHVNKHRGADGRPIYAGTTDLLEDFDCAHLLYDIADDPKAKLKTILFECIKARGQVARRKAYQYSTAEGQTYEELLRSIRAVNLDEVDNIGHAQRRREDSKLMEAISESIRAGTTLKMSLVERVCNATRSSRREVMDVLDRYCGSDPSKHLWDFTVGERGGKSYRLITEDTEADPDKY